MVVFKKIGEVFQNGLTNLIVAEDESQEVKSCKSCAALLFCGGVELPDCVKDKREDKKNVHFEIKK